MNKKETFHPKLLSPYELEQVNLVLQECKDLRSINRMTNKGISPTKNMAMWAKFPIFFSFHPEIRKYFDKEADVGSRNGELTRLASRMINQFGWNFYCVDNP